MSENLRYAHLRSPTFEDGLEGRSKGLGELMGGRVLHFTTVPTHHMWLFETVRTAKW